MLKRPLARVVLGAVLLGTSVLSVSKAQGQYPQTYGGCVQAASYQLAECLDWFPQSSGLCWDTFYFLRDDPLGCKWFGEE